MKPAMFGRPLTKLGSSDRERSATTNGKLPYWLKSYLLPLRQALLKAADRPDSSYRLKTTEDVLKRQTAHKLCLGICCSCNPR